MINIQERNVNPVLEPLIFQLTKKGFRLKRSSLGGVDVDYDWHFPTIHGVTFEIVVNLDERSDTTRYSLKVATEGGKELSDDMSIIISDFFDRSIKPSRTKYKASMARGGANSIQIWLNKALPLSDFPDVYLIVEAFMSLARLVNSNLTSFASSLKKKKPTARVNLKRR